jgi:hypothetical protein
MATPHVTKFGKSTILVHDDDFSEGYSNGLIHHTNQESPLTVEAIRNMIAESFLDVLHTDAWNTGYVCGAIRGIYEGAYLQQDEDAPSVQLGTLTLRLNRWRFKDGFFNGQEDYQESQNEQATPDTLTARDLLRYIAHRDSEKDTFFFGDDELSALEDVLGQLVGYLCAALFPHFPKPTQERDAKPLQAAILQEAFMNGLR